MTGNLIQHEAVLDAPPSAKLCYLVLLQKQPCTTAQLVAETGLSANAVRNGINHLEGLGVVRHRTSFSDARKRKYRLTGLDQ